MGVSGYFKRASLLPAAAGIVAAQPGGEAAISALETSVKTAQTSGDNAWMLTSAALVLMMTGPGLALFYGGLVRRKNVLGTMMQSFVLMAVITVLWAVCGYSLEATSLSAARSICCSTVSGPRPTRITRRPSRS
jgi:hypothetical protein